MRRRPVSLFAAALAFLLPLLFVTSVAVPSWTARHALLAVEAAVGLPVCLALLRSPARAPAVAGLAFAGWALVATAASPDHTTAFWGLFGWGTGVLFVLAVLGSWAVGMAAGAEGGRWVERAIVWAAAINAGVAVLQTLVDLSSFQLDLVDTRPTALLGNPVFLGALAAGAIWLVALRAARRPAAAAALVVLLAAACELSGSRVALAVAAAAVLGVFAARRWRAAAALVVCLVLGMGLGAVTAHFGRTTTATGRGQVASGIRPRVDTWFSARHAIARHPLLGSGPGRFRAATSPERTLRVVRAEGPDRLFADAHNLFVEYTVTTGLPGLALVGCWLALVVRRAGWRTPLAGFGLAVLATHLLQPQNVALTPLALLALGAAHPIPDPLRAVVPLTVRFVLAIAAVGTAALLMVGSWFLEQARLDVTVDPANNARELLPAWPEPVRRLAAGYTFLARTRHDPHDARLARRWREVAVHRDPTDPLLWNELADAELGDRLPERAGVDYRRALEWDPWSVRALNGLAQVAIGRGDREQAVRLLRRSLVAAPNQRFTQRELAKLKASP